MGVLRRLAAVCGVLRRPAASCGFQADPKKRSSREVGGVSPEAGKESMVGKICERGRS